MSTSSYIVGLDVGNYDTKTQKTSTPSGITVNPTVTGDITLRMNGNLYCPNENRQGYVKDKTQTEVMFILSLMGISEEIIESVKNKWSRRLNAGREEPKNKNTYIQKCIDDIVEVKLGIGVPIVNFAKQKSAYVEYYENHFKDGVDYEYRGFHFCYKVSTTRCYPQGFAAVLTYNPRSLEKSIIRTGTYYVVDIGGWTVDIVTIVKNTVTEKCTSKPYGVLAMFEHIHDRVESQTNIVVEQRDIEAVLKKEDNYLPEEVREIIRTEAKAWFEKIENELVQYGLNIDVRPTLFMGGGSQLLKPYIKARKGKSFTEIEFYSDAKANAMAYAALLASGK